jgi:putative CocE/NonD family hydrolase
MEAMPRLIIEKGIMVRMRDGVRLATDVYLPDDEGRFPVILVRTPYDKGDPLLLNAVNFDPVRGAQAGYAVCVQDVRGRYSSEGCFKPLHQEVEDGYDSVEWCAAQPWSTGRVGMAGASYVGATQWLAAIASPPHLFAFAPNVTASNYHEGWFYRGGALEWGFLASWTLGSLAYDTAIRESSLKSKLEVSNQVLAAIDDLGKWFWHLPIMGFPPLKGVVNYFFEWLEHTCYDDYWRRINIEEHYESVKAAALNIGGWYDIFCYGTIRNYMGLRSRGGSEAAKSSRLIVGPWAHSTRSTLFEGNLVGDVNFGVKAASKTVGLMELQLRWFDYWLKCEENGVLKEPAAKLFVMGDNAWCDMDDFPSSRTRPVSLYLHSDGHANGVDGSGFLSLDAPVDEPPDRFDYDPLNPVPTNGGALCCSEVFIPGGAYDQREVEKRSDVLVYTSAPLKEPLRLIGSIRTQLFVVTSARDTDFTAKLVDVHPDEKAINLADGVLRMRFRNGREKEDFVVPGETHGVCVELGYTAHAFGLGHSVRLEVSSSNFPRFDRNMNTGGTLFREDGYAVAKQSVLHDSVHPSALYLMVDPQSSSSQAPSFRKV